PNEVIDRIYSLFHSECLVTDPDLLGRLLAGDPSALGNSPADAPIKHVRRQLIAMMRRLVPHTQVSEDKNSPVALHGTPLSVRSLSDGYGSLLSLTGHIVRHGLSFFGGTLSLPDLYAIVLVDEIDLHLHPSWQRRVLRDLVQVFPRTQFILSS